MCQSWEQWRYRYFAHDLFGWLRMLHQLKEVVVAVSSREPATSNAQDRGRGDHPRAG